MFSKITSSLFFMVVCFSPIAHSDEPSTDLSKSVLKTYQSIESDKELLEIFKDYMTLELRSFLTKINWKKLKKEVSISRQGEALLLTSGKHKATIEFINNKIWINNTQWTFAPWKSPAVSLGEIQKILNKKKQTVWIDIFEKLFFERANAGAAVVIALVAPIYLLGATALHWATKSKCAREVKDLNMPTPNLSCKLRTIWPFSHTDTQVVNVECKKSGERELKDLQFDQVKLRAANGEEITATSSHYIVLNGVHFEHTDVNKKKIYYDVVFQKGENEIYASLGVPYWPFMEGGSYSSSDDDKSHLIHTEPLLTVGKGMVETTYKLEHYLDMCNNDPGAIEEINEQGKQLIKSKAGEKDASKNAVK